jgi:hypothetical protein
MKLLKNRETLVNTLNKNKTPIRIFAELVHYPLEILTSISICIAEESIKFASSKARLIEVLSKYKEYPIATKDIDLLLCKRLLNELKAVRPPTRAEMDPRYWQWRADRLIISGLINLYYLLIKEDNFREIFNQLIKNLTQAYGASESKKQLKEMGGQQYDFGDTTNSLIRVQQYNTTRAQNSRLNGERVAYHEYLRVLRGTFI